MTWVTAAPAASLEDGQVKVVELAERRIALCRVDGEYFAVDDLCTHDGGPLDQGRVDDHSIECPRHGARFDIRTGRVLALPAVRPVKAYSTRIAGDSVEVEVP